MWLDESVRCIGTLRKCRPLQQTIPNKDRSRKNRAGSRHIGNAILTEGSRRVVGLKTRIWLKKFVGLTIAHVLAVQLILTAALATQMAFVPGDDQAICHSLTHDSPEGDHQQPAQQAHHHEACRICAFAASSHVLSHQLPGLLIWPSRATGLFAAAWLDQLPIRGHEPRTSQGPPPLV